LSSVLDVPVQLVVAFALAVSPAAPEGNHEVGSFSVPQIEAGETSRAGSAPSHAMPEQLWLAAFRAHASEHPLSRRIYKTTTGRYYVPAEPDRQLILALGADERVSGFIVRRVARDNAALLFDRLGRLPTAGELYVAHLFGVENAALALRGREVSSDVIESVKRYGVLIPGMTVHDAVRVLRLAVDEPLQRAAQLTAMAQFKPAITETDASRLASRRLPGGHAQIGRSEVRR
jgi:hypothetical protein